MINIKDCKSGYILKGQENHKAKIVDGHNERGHFIIFYDYLNGYDFVGAMITTTDYNGINEPMQENYFNEVNEYGDKCTVVYSNSFLVPAKLHKFHSMGEFEFVGQLTDLGISFMVKIIGNLDIMTWDDYKLT
ncbi:hypothetical protein ACFX5E_00185 [Flavobacterium sp. LS2P90]|uniref:YopX protein domain-containing protein n=1 Tax=Flavobacterium xylosi TaxID=3230415 RepID=A0ABW6HR58_9FLAO